MTGTTERKDPPRNDEEFARDVDRRLDLAEHPDSVRCGQWVLWTDESGNLVGSHVEGGSAIIQPRPPDGVDPEAVAESELPSVSVARSATQNIPSGGAEVIFDGIISEVGDWRTRSSAVTVLQVPESGVYDLAATVWYALGGTALHSVILVDGVTRIGGRVYEGAGAAWLSVTAVGQLYLPAGSAVSLFASAAGGSRQIGASTAFATAIPTTLSLSMHSRG